MHWLKHSAAAVAAALSLNTSIASANAVTDLWYNPQESGWGVNIVQQDDIAFLTLFVYGPDGTPQWFVAPETRATDLAADGRPYFEGALYKTRGAWLGGPFDPNSVTVTRVGTVTLSPIANGQMRIEYDVNGVSVNKVIQRQTWRSASVFGNYVGAFSQLKQTGSGTPVREVNAANIALYIDNGSALLRVDDDNQVRCEYLGDYTQTGRLGSFGGGFSCSNGRTGTFQVDELEISNQGISAKFKSTWAGGSSNGRFGGPRR